MKKRIIISIFVILFAILGGLIVTANLNTGINSDILDMFRFMKEESQDKTVAATVNGEPIYKYSIEFSKRSTELSKKNALAQIESLPIKEEEKQNLREKIEQNIIIKSDSEILSGIIRGKVILQQAIKNGFSSNYDEAYAEAKATIDLLKSEATKDNPSSGAIENYNFIIAYLKEMGWSESEYLKKGAEAIQIELTKNNLLIEFKKTIPENTDSSTIDKLYNEYIDKLVEEADVKIYIN